MTRDSQRSGASVRDSKEKRRPSVSTSLYDDTLSSSRSGKRWNWLIWVLILLFGAGGILAAFLSPTAEDRVLERMRSMEEEREEERRNSPLATALEEVRSQEKGDETLTPDGESAVQTTNEPTISSGPSPPEAVEEPVEPEPSSTASEAGRQVEAEPAPEPSPVPESVQATASPRDERAIASTPDVPSNDPPGEVATVPSSTEDQEGEFDASQAADDSVAAADTPRGAEAYETLLQHSESAARLVSGDYSTLRFERWRVVQETPSETWIDLVGSWTRGGDEVHFIWAVERESGEVKALSEAARNLAP